MLILQASLSQDSSGINRSFLSLQALHLKH
jgi:hypothetical protein